jgi:hypothetical protein
MNEEIRPQEIFVFIGIFIAMFGFLIYGFFFAGIGKVDNCWDSYATEEQAIINCEGVNK